MTAILLTRIFASHFYRFLLAISTDGNLLIMSWLLDINLVKRKPVSFNLEAIELVMFAKYSIEKFDFKKLSI